MNTILNGVSRRSFVTAAAGLTAGLGIARLSGPAYAAEALPALPWKKYYPGQGLNPQAVREAAYCLYFTEGGCGHGSAQAIIDALAAALDAEGAPENPWKLLPRGLYSYGAGGVVGWGTLCGALNGSVAVMDILGMHGQLGNELMNYFCTTELPTSALEGYVPPAGVPVPLKGIATSISNSPLCHNSVSQWAAVAGVPVADASKKDRCAKLVGDIVAKAAELMNLYLIEGGQLPAWVAPANYASCYTCHTKPDMVPSQQGRMDCTECHDVAPSHSSRRKRKGRSGG